MTCFHPIKAYELIDAENPSGKKTIVFHETHIGKHDYTHITVPCNGCYGCRIDYSKQWAIRCFHESLGFSENSFITLTINETNMNKYRTLIKSEHQKFMKRLRKKSSVIRAELGKEPKKIRYFHCGEYGSKKDRPHYHTLLFNFDFPDKYIWDKRDGYRVYRSPMLEELWTMGFSSIGEVTYESCAYVARYILKKMTGTLGKEYYKKVNFETGEHWKVLPEYTTMSRRPGIGKKWIKENYSDVYPKDYFTIKGNKFKPPRYYDAIYEYKEPEKFLEIKEKRGIALLDKADNITPQRLAVREEILKRRCKKLIRSFENGTQTL